MNINIHTVSTRVDVPICTSVEDNREAMSKDAELQMPKTYIFRGWLLNKEQVEPAIERYWSLRPKLVMIDGTAVIGK